MQFLREPLDKVVQKVLADIAKAAGCGGVIALDRKGNGGYDVERKIHKH